MKRSDWNWIGLLVALVVCLAISFKYDPPPVAAEQVLYTH